MKTSALCFIKKDAESFIHNTKKHFFANGRWRSRQVRFRVPKHRRRCRKNTCENTGNIFNTDYSHIWNEKMPIVHVNVWEGFGKEKAKTVIQKITKVFVDVGIPAQAVEVIVHEIPRTHWGIGGEPASEKFKDLK